MENAKSLMTKLHVMDNDDDDGECLIYWRSWTSTGNESGNRIARYTPQFFSRGGSHSKTRRRPRGGHQNDPARRSPHRNAVSEDLMKPVENSQDGFKNREKSSSSMISDKNHTPTSEHAPSSLSIPRTNPLLDWIASPLTPLSMTTSLNRRTMGTISEDEALSIMCVPEIVVTPPSPQLVKQGNDQADRRGNVIFLNPPAVTGHEVFDAETEEQRDMLRKEWVEYVWGDWMGDDEVDDYSRGD